MEETSTLMIVTRNGNQGGFTVNGNASILTAADFLPVAGSAGSFVYCKKELGTTMPLHAATRVVNSIGKFQLGFLNGASPTMTTGCRYGYFSLYDISDFSQTTGKAESRSCFLIWSGSFFCYKPPDRPNMLY